MKYYHSQFLMPPFTIYPTVMIALNSLCGLLALIYGVYLMSEGLKKINSKALQKALTLFTGNIWTAFITGIVSTAVVQSSSAVTVITLSFVNAGLMQLYQAIGIIYGANIGTTVTAQLMSLELGKIAFPIFLLGCILTWLSPKKKPIRHIGLAILGLGLMFMGLQILQTNVPYIMKSERAYRLFLTYGQNPYTGLLLGLLTTIFIQSSSATIGLAIIIFNANLINLESAIGLILGNNIGTCITAQLASIKSAIEGKRTAWAHTLYNALGVCIALIFLPSFTQIVRFTTTVLHQDSTRLIANAHTLFNVLNAILFLPFTKFYVTLLERIVVEPYQTLTRLGPTTIKRYR